MKNIRKYLTGLAAAGFAIVSAVPAHAVFTSHGTNTVTASATVGGTPTIAITSVSVKNRSDNSTAGGLTWSGATPGGGFLLADQYIQMVTNINTTDGGVQIYTDNTNVAASPKFTGSVSTFTATPAGLVDNADTTQKLPTAWRASTFTIAGITPSDPNNTSDPNRFLWFFHEDHAQVKVPSISATTFGNGDPFVTVYASPNTPLVAHQLDNSGNETTQTFTTTASNSGLHFAQGPTEFGGFNAVATTDIYTEADFTGAFASTTYSTSRLILEAFSL